MINIKLLKDYMTKNATATFEDLADEIGVEAATVKGYIAAGDMPISIAERIALTLEIPASEWSNVFLADPMAQHMAPSDYSCRIQTLAEDDILESFDRESLAGAHNVLDELLVAWQLTDSYSNDTPEHLKKAVAAAEAAIPEDAFPEELVANVEDAAVMHGFALGVQFAAAAAKSGGAVWALLRQELGLWGGVKA